VFSERHRLQQIGFAPSPEKEKRMTGAALATIDVKPEIKVTRGNLARLNTLLAIHAPIRSWRAVEFLVRELMRATIVDEEQLPATIATIGSTVEFHEGGSELKRVGTLVHLSGDDFYDNAIPVLTPVGAALIGLSEGQSISYGALGGRLSTITLVKVLYQPEANSRAQS
jgi:regulator of nucleoside diphosphate kinase